MTVKNKSKGEDCLVLIARCCGTLIALPKDYLSAVTDYEEVVFLDNLKQPLIGVAQNAGKAILLADPKFLIDGKRKKTHIPKFLVFFDHLGGNLSFQIDEIIGIKAIKLPSIKSYRGKGKKNDLVIRAKLGRSSILFLRIDILFGTLLGEQSGVNRESAVELLTENKSNSEKKSFLSFVVENEQFAIDVDNLNRVSPIGDITIIGESSDNSFAMANFEDTLCPFIGKTSSKYAFQAFFSSSSKDYAGRHMLAIGSENECKLHTIFISDLVQTNRSVSNKKDGSTLNELAYLLEQSSAFGFDSKKDEHLRVVDLEKINELKVLYPYAPKIKRLSTTLVNETVSLLAVLNSSYNYLFPLDLLKKVAPLSEIKISKNQNINMLGYTEIEGRVIAVFDLDVILGGHSAAERNYAVFFEIDDIQAALVVPSIRRVSISKNRIQENIRNQHDAMFQSIAASRVNHFEDVYYQIDIMDLKERFVRLST